MTFQPVQTRRKIWMFYLISLAMFCGALFFGLLSLPSISMVAKIALFVFTAGTSIIISKNLIDIYIGEGSVRQNIQDIIVTMMGFMLVYGAGLLIYFFFFSDIFHKL